MNYKKTILLALLILNLSLSINAQKTVKGLERTGYKYYALEDTTTMFEYKDSIRFVMSGKTQKPTIFFIQGSSAHSLFVIKEGKWYSWIHGVVPVSIYEDFNLVFISKPGLPLSVPYGGSSWEKFSRKERNIFSHCDTKQYYISAIKQVYNYLITNNLVIKNKVYIIGHSQGYGVSAKYAALFPDDFKKVVCMSSSIYNIPAIRVSQYYKKAYQGKESQTDIKNRIDSIYANFENIYNLVKDTANKYFPYYRRDYSLWSDLSINFLLQIKKPLLVVYGMDDADASDNSVLPIIFISKHKENLSVFAYPNYGHNYYEQIYDAEGKPLKKVKHWHDVFIDVSNWLLE